MIILLSYLASIAFSAITADGTKLIITDPDSNSLKYGSLAGHETATSCEITSTTQVTIGQQTFQALTALTKVTITAPKVTLENQAFQQSGNSGSIIINATETVTIGKDAFISATLGGIEIYAGQNILLGQQAFQQITKAANLTLVAGGIIDVGLDCFITSPIEAVKMIATGNVTLQQQSFQQCTQITNLYIESKQGGIVLAISSFIAAAIQEVTLISNLDVVIAQQAMQQVANFDKLTVITNGSFVAGEDAFISSSIKEFFIHSNGNVTFEQQAYQQTKRLNNFTIIANGTIDFGITSFISSNVGSIVLTSTGPIIFGQQSFQGCINLTSVVIHTPSNVTLGDSCFISSQIENLNITSTNTTENSGALLLADANTISFEKNSFSQCNQLKNVNVNTNGNVDIGAGTFSDSKSLSNVHVHAGGKATIGDNAFSGCSALKSGANIDASEKVESPNAYGDGGSGGGSSDKKKKSGSSHKDNDDDDESSAKTLGNIKINSVYLGTSPNIVVNLNIFVKLMRNARRLFGHVVPAPDFIHSAIWVGEKEPSDDTLGAIFVYGKYWNKHNLDSYLGQDGAKAFVMSFGEFKQRYPSIDPVKLNTKRKMNLFDFIKEVKGSGNWGAKDYNWPTNNCQHFTAKLVDILHATRNEPNNNDWIDIPKPIMKSLKANENN
ncbi:hypothetical protein M9Y10_018408 [Tritrichomonas musculus]|uniref:Uncharacterized protein n=1 Tax=Tritrichomonas musculus TaxID=1915356 RepID=A0ABR2HNJ6_9EUKA